ncbi:MAG: AglZ/HisF2 family acetamidino modification protein [Thermoanaerobaculia bacterium]
MIPCLLMSNGGLVKTVKFSNPKYVGDPVNAVRIFNDKEVDEMVFLDIDATREKRGPNFQVLADIASEAFMPFGYGGGITTVDQVRQLYALGIEKVILNSAAVTNPRLVEEAASIAGNSGVVVSIDVRRSWLGRRSVYINGGRRDTRLDPVMHAREMERAGAGEILLTSIDRDGTMEGYDLDLIEQISSNVGVPVVAAGGAGELRHFREAVDHGAAGLAAGSMFVFHGRHRAVLITYPEYQELERLFA